MPSPRPAGEKVNIDRDLAQRLVAEQFPKWARLPVEAVEPGGWDNRTFRLGREMSLRLPSAEAYAAQVAKEQRCLPKLAALLPLPIPSPLALGAPGRGFPWAWSVYRWIEGETASAASIADLVSFATELARFLTALQDVDAGEGPPPGPHCFFRGGSLAVYDAETRQALEALRGDIDTAAACALWDRALASSWTRAPVWVHGDLSATNLLMRDGRLSAVIDFGSCAVGDPACDLVIAWTFFSGKSREAFRAGLPLDEATWARARGWALWKALITLAERAATRDTRADSARRVIADVLAEDQRSD